jgi:hypothetical protein
MIEGCERQMHAGAPLETWRAMASRQAHPRSGTNATVPEVYAARRLSMDRAASFRGRKRRLKHSSRIEMLSDGRRLAKRACSHQASPTARRFSIWRIEFIRLLRVQRT